MLHNSQNQIHNLLYGNMTFTVLLGFYGYTKLHKNPENPTLWNAMTISGSAQNYYHTQKKNYRGGEERKLRTQTSTHIGLVEIFESFKMKLDQNALMQSGKSEGVLVLSLFHWGCMNFDYESLCPILCILIMRSTYMVHLRVILEQWFSTFLTPRSPTVHNNIQKAM